MATLLAASGCATLSNQPAQKITIDTRPPGATARILPDGTTVVSPAQVPLERRQAHTIRLEKEGYCAETVYLDRVSSKVKLVPGGAVFVVGAIASGALQNPVWILLATPLAVAVGLAAVAVDTSTQRGYELTPSRVEVVLWPADSPDRACGPTSSRPRRPEERLPTPEPL